jgi:hypothetical protein
LVGQPQLPPTPEHFAPFTGQSLSRQQTLALFVMH